jgi:hypothetical protein
VNRPYHENRLTNSGADDLHFSLRVAFPRTASWVEHGPGFWDFELFNFGGRRDG